MMGRGTSPIEALKRCLEQLVFLYCQSLLEIHSWRLRKRSSNLRIRETSTTKILLEAGQEGWKLIEYQELYQSAIEFFGSDQVEKLTVPSDGSYWRIVVKSLRECSATHFFFDPRSGSQKFLKSLIESYQISKHLISMGIVPVVRITDIPVRRWRLQARLVALKRGLVLTLMHPSLTRHFFPKENLFGPSLMPFSKNTLQALKEKMPHHSALSPTFPVSFAGSVYEPRKSELESIRGELLHAGILLTTFERTPGAPREDSSIYWSRIRNSKVVITTASQARANGLDFLEDPHLIYRYTEVLAVGTALVAPRVKGADAYLTPGVHYLHFEESKDACAAVSRLLLNEDYRQEIASSGHKRLTELIESGEFWRAIDRGLGEENGFTGLRSKQEISEE